jgi:adenylylsulfate kinase
MKCFVIWITGLPGSGKSTIADEIQKHLPGFFVLRMDTLRQMVTPDPTFSEQERELVYRCLVYLASTLSGLGHNVIIDATGNRRRWRDMARTMIRDFAEIYLKCPVEICVDREKQRDVTRNAPKDIYDKASAGWPVPGIVVPYEEPLNAEVVIETDTTTPQEAASRIERYLIRRVNE